MPGKAHVLDKIMRFRLGRRHPPPEVVYASRASHPISIRCFSSGFRYTRQWRERGLYSLFDVGLCVCSAKSKVSGGSIWMAEGTRLAGMRKVVHECAEQPSLFVGFTAYKTFAVLLFLDGFFFPRARSG